MMSSSAPTAPTYTEKLQKLAVPSVCALIAFLSYSSQIIFHWLDPGPLSTRETIWINILILCIWTTYYKAVTTNPGHLPKKLKERGVRDLERARSGQPNWCRKCDAIKPPRSHHCKICKRCIPKMDHHCPWTANCTSARTLPPFLRFLFYTVFAMSYFSTILYQRVTYFWTNSNKSWQGVDEAPLWSIIWLFVVCVIVAIILFILTVLLVTSVQSLVLNATMIEQWEMQRHEALVKRAKKNGGRVSTPGGGDLHINQQEFPYDVGIWNNICQGMGSSNPLLWFIPWLGGPPNDSVWDFPTNGFEEPGETWPPPDPEKIPQPKWQRRRDSLEGDGFPLGKSAQYGDDRVVADFKKRQEADFARGGLRQEVMASGRSTESMERSYEWLEMDSSTDDDSDFCHEKIKKGLEEEYDGATESRYGWRNGDGERLADFGVDEDAEGCAEGMGVLDEKEDEEEEDDLPLSELIRRRKSGQVSAK